MSLHTYFSLLDSLTVCIALKLQVTSKDYYVHDLCTTRQGAAVYNDPRTNSHLFPSHN
eukprot:c35661_g1_i1 orf=3-173(-)